MLTPSPTELTTGATDAMLALECAALALWLRRAGAEQLPARLWCWALGLLGLASALGAAAHGLVLGDAARRALWPLLYLSLASVMVLVLLGAVAEWRGPRLVRRAAPWVAAGGLAGFGATQLLGGAFIVFVLFEAAALLAALAIYLRLAAGGRKGTRWMAAGVLLSLSAAGLQTTGIGFVWVLPFDHNAVFHLVQMAAVALLGAGLRPAGAGSLRLGRG